MRSKWIGPFVSPGSSPSSPTSFSSARKDASSPEESFAARESEPEPPAGFRVRGPNFYVWEESERDAEEWASEARRAGVPAVAESPERSSSFQAVLDRARFVPDADRDEEFEEGEEHIDPPGRGAGAAWVPVPVPPEADPLDDRAFSPLGRVLSSLSLLRRTWLITTWAAASDPRRRRALAQALADPFDAIGVRSVLERLREDPDLDVRRLAEDAAHARGLALE